MGKPKEDIRVEKIIRDLLKLPDNRRCINCKSLGPQYVCTTFWTYVCTNCSGVHQEFSHRVKSISMAKFNSEEVSGLQAGGNERAKQVYFKTWDTQRHSFPDNSNIHKLRDFIKHVYVERRYTAESHLALVSRFINIENEEPYAQKSEDPIQKPWFRQRSLDRYGKYSFKEQSSGYERENNSRDRYGALRSTSYRFEGGEYQVDDARIAGRSATAMFTTADLRPKAKSPDTSLPTAPHVREILGENCPRLRVEDQPKPSERRNSYDTANNAQIRDHSKAINRNVDCPTRGQERHRPKSGYDSKSLHRRSISACTQKDVHSINQTSMDNAEIKPKSGSAGSLVNITNVLHPEACMEQQQETCVEINGGNSDSSQPPPAEETAPNIPAKNTLEYLLFELSCPVETPFSNDSAVSAIEETEKSTSTQQPLQHSIISVLDSSSPCTWQPQQYTSIPVLDGTTSSTQQQQPQQHSVLSFLDGAAATQQPQQHFTISVLDSATSSMQTSSSKEVADNQLEALPIVPSFAVSTLEKNCESQPSILEAGSSGRAELSSELFSSFHLQGRLSGWQMGSGHSMGFNMQYQPASMQLQAFPNLSKSRNPFDTDDTPTQHYATNTMFPSTASLQGGLHNLSPSPNISHTSNFGSDCQGFVPTHSSSYPSGAYMEHSIYSNMEPTRQQGLGGHGSEQRIVGSWNLHQQSQHTYEAQTNMNSFPRGGGNPFG